MRIIAGHMRGRTLHIPRAAAFRPTTDRVKESLFNILEQLVPWEERHVCDLFAGSGNLGLEALSRGAKSATFVERSRASLATLERNISTLGLEARCIVLPIAVEQFCRRSGQRFGLLFADPPYAYEQLDALIATLPALLLPDGIAVIEHSGDTSPAAADGITPFDRRSYGTTAVTFFRSQAGETSCE